MKKYLPFWRFRWFVELEYLPILKVPSIRPIWRSLDIWGTGSCSVSWQWLYPLPVTATMWWLTRRAVWEDANRSLSMVILHSYSSFFLCAYVLILFFDSCSYSSSSSSFFFLISILLLFFYFFICSTFFYVSRYFYPHLISAFKRMLIGSQLVSSPL